MLNEPTLPEMDVLERAKALRSKIQESFAKATIAMMALLRYRSQSIADLDQIVFNPLIRNRIAFAYAQSQDTTEQGRSEQDHPEQSASQSLPMDDMAGLAIWASVSEEVDAKIREQIAAGVFPIKLKAEDWDSGEVNWLFDVIAPSKERTAQVVRNQKQVIKQGDLHIHPLVAKLISTKDLETMGAKRQVDAQKDITDAPIQH